jgi:inosine-uridine nucleoside N-ribohydrolase
MRGRWRLRDHRRFGHVRQQCRAGTPSAEFNVGADPQAAALVLAAGFSNLTRMPLDATQEAVISLDQYQTLRESRRPAAEAAAIFVEKRIEGYRSHRSLSDRNAAPIHDALSAPALIEPDIIETADYCVAVETAGASTGGRAVIETSFRSSREPNARVAMNADTEGFGRFVLDTPINNRTLGASREERE